jgi:hypothetical protein
MRTRSLYEAVQMSAAVFALYRMYVLREGTLGKYFFCVCRRNEPYDSTEDLFIDWVVKNTAEVPSDGYEHENWT